MRVLVLLVALAGCRQILGIHDRGEGDDDTDPGVGSGGTPPSCAALTESCAGRDCCESRLVPGGMFSRSYDVASDGMFADPVAEASVKSFRLDRFEVTVGRYRAYLAEAKITKDNPPVTGSGANAFFPASGWDSNFNAMLPADRPTMLAALTCGSATMANWTTDPGANETLPMNCVTWYEAHQFCAWDKGFLPTEVEWNYAAAGGDEQRAYPWSDPPGDLTLTSDDVVYVDVHAYPVGSKPAGLGRWRHADLAGNVGEWVLDRSGAYVIPCADCASFSGGNTKVHRGGWYQQTEMYSRTGYRGGNAPQTRVAAIGFRCARLP